MPTDLKSQLTLLKSLQDIDVLLHRIESEIESIPAKIEEAMADFRASSNLISKKKSEKAELEKARKNEEVELDAEVAHIKEREARLYAIKTNKEYQAAIKEIADAKQSNKESEESLLRLMEGVDKINEEIAQLSGGLADKERSFKEKEAELKKIEASLLAERDKQLALRAEAEKNIDKTVLREYRYIQNRFSDAMSLAVNGVCTGCNKKIPPQVYIEMQKWSELITCPNCYRLLFYEEEAEKAAEEK